MDNATLLGIGTDDGYGYDLPELAPLADRSEAQTDSMLCAASNDTIAGLAGELEAAAKTRSAALSPTGKRRLARVRKVTGRQMTQRGITKTQRYQPGKTYNASTYPRAQARKASGSYAATWQPPGPRWNKPTDMLAIGLAGVQDDSAGNYTLAGHSSGSAAEEALQGLGSWFSRAVRTVAPVLGSIAPLAASFIPGAGLIAAPLSAAISAGLYNGIPGQSAAVTQAMTAQQQAARPVYPIPTTPEEFAAYAARMLGRNQNTIRALTAPGPAPAASTNRSTSSPITVPTWNGAGGSIPWDDMGVPDAPAPGPSAGLDKNTLLILGGLAVLLIASRK